MIQLENVSKIFGTGTAGLSEVNLAIENGEFVFLVGHTGSGKTTLLRLLVRDMLPSQGTIIVGDFDVTKLPNGKIPELRKKIGVVFQDLKLLMDRTIFENVLLPLEVSGQKGEEALKRVEELLDEVGLIEHKEKFPVQLSGGELQRVAIARALALRPEILLADEPTGNLDPQTALEIVELLSRINENGTTIIMATHNLEIVDKLHKRVVGLEKGKVVKDESHGKKHQAKHEEKKEEKEDKKETKEDDTDKEEEHALSVDELFIKSTEGKDEPEKGKKKEEEGKEKKK